MNEPQQINQNDTIFENEIDFKELFFVLWNGKKKIIVITVLSAIFTLIIAMSMTNIYTSESFLSVKESSSQTSNLSSYSGLASLAGISLPGSGNKSKGEFVQATVLSRAFLEHLLTFEHVLPSLMAVDYYDEDSQVLFFDKNKYDLKTEEWVGDADPLTAIEVYKTYQETVYASYDKKTGFFYLSARHVSPIFAKEFLDLIISEINNLLREKDLEESSNALEFLTSEINNTSLLEVKSAINELMTTQLQTQMMTKISKDYVLEKIEPPFVPILASSPNKILILLMGTLLGVIISLLWVLLPHYYTASSEG